MSSMKLYRNQKQLDSAQKTFISSDSQKHGNQIDIVVDEKTTIFMQHSTKNVNGNNPSPLEVKRKF